ncbi:MAG: hypothetical protein AAF401_04520 [Pseudomonadota bacterium]
MGSPGIESWDAWEKGAYYMGAASSWESIWLIVSIIMCVLAIIIGSRHEKDAYRKAEKK